MMACLRFLRNFQTSHLLSAAGLVVAAAGTVYLARRFWRTAELEEDQQHLLALEDSDASADLDLTLDEIVNEDNGQVMTWDFSPLFCGPFAAVRLAYGTRRMMPPRDVDLRLTSLPGIPCLKLLQNRHERSKEGISCLTIALKDILK